MPDVHVSLLQSLGVVLLALAAAVWVIGLVHLLRRARSAAGPRHPGHTPKALPHQHQPGPHRETVELTPAERDAFAGLVRQLSDGH